MIKRDGSSTSGTSWQSYDVARIWELVKDHHTDNHWKQVAGWRKTYELTQTHMSHLKQYRAGLVEAWPPGKSEAAGLYIAYLDHLIENVQQTYETAQANYTTLSAATMAISQTREKVRKLYDEYTLKRQQKHEYDQRVAADRDSLLPGTSTGKPPVTDPELERLNESARGLMVGLSGELVEARVQIRQPPRYNGKTPIDDPPGSTPPGDGTLLPPAIPPIVHVGLPPALPPASSPPNAVPVPTPTTPGSGPVLGGSSPPSTIPLPANLAPPASIPSTSPPNTFSPVGGLTPPFSTGPSPTPPFQNGTGASIKPGTGGMANTTRAMPPGGLIGSTPTGGIGHPRSGAAIRRTNPVGGVIGGNQGQTASAKLRRRPGHNDDEERRWDPDNLWETAEGVTPVVLPPPEPGLIDPGPSIGFNR
ncbi:hypothetical protein ACWDV4_03675 [Micromonospora sp. NPDC003197]